MPLRVSIDVYEEEIRNVARDAGFNLENTQNQDIDAVNDAISDVVEQVVGENGRNASSSLGQNRNVSCVTMIMRSTRIS